MRHEGEGDLWLRFVTPSPGVCKCGAIPEQHRWDREERRWLAADPRYAGRRSCAGYVCHRGCGTNPCTCRAVEEVLSKKRSKQARANLKACSPCKEALALSDENFANFGAKLAARLKFEMAQRAEAIADGERVDGLLAALEGDNES